MKHFDIELSTELKNVIYDRRIKLLFTMYIISFVLFSLVIIKNIYYSNYTLLAVSIVVLFSIFLSYIFLFKNKRYNHASYTILFIIACAIITTTTYNKFDNYSAIFIIPFPLSTFFLFSWKKGFFINIIFFIFLIITIIIGKNYFDNGIFINNPISISNFVIILFVIFIFTYFFELTRVEAYKLLLESNLKKDLLYRELQHRVKNNLNIVSSMLAMQALNEDQNVKNIIEVSKNRIDSIAMIHTMLNVSNDIEKVDVKAFLEKLSNNLTTNCGKEVTIKLNIKKQELPLNEIIPIGLIINELLTNSFKYAFEKIKNAKIVIVLKDFKGKSILTYHDNGSGLKNSNITNMGLKLVKLNVKQLKGTIKVNHKNGLGYKIVYKRDTHV